MSAAKGAERSGAAAAVDRALKKNASDTMASYDGDAEAIARVLSRHYGDEAGAVLDRARHFLDVAATKRDLKGWKKR